MAIPVNLLRTLCVIRKHKALFDRVFPATVAGKTRVHIPQTPAKTSVDGITRTFSSLLQGYAISGKLIIGKFVFLRHGTRRGNRI